MIYAGELAGVGLPEALCVIATKIHRGMVYWEFDVSRSPIIECFLNCGSYRRGLVCTLVLPGGRWRECRQYLENLLGCLSKDY